MAEYEPTGLGNLICRFFAAGECKYGKNCPFTHRIPDPNSVLDVVCRYHLVGRCIYGASCWYVHIRPLPPNLFPVWANRHTRESVTTDGHHGGKRQTSRSANNIDAPSTSSRSSSSNEMSAAEFWGIHGRASKFEPCKFCERPCLILSDKEQQQKHLRKCIRRPEKDDEYSKVMANSSDKMCGICMDIIMEKENFTERRFGVLENCNHVFCLQCIRRWRGRRADNSGFDTTMTSPVARTCPECRTSSDFVMPSEVWIDNTETKEKMIHEYKEAMSKKNCKYFRKGDGFCPFAGACFYLHVNKNGEIIKMPPPKSKHETDENDQDMNSINLWDIQEDNIWEDFALGIDIDDSDNDWSQYFLY